MTSKRSRQIAMGGTIVAGLAITLAAWAQNLIVKGSTTGEQSAYFATGSGNVGIGTTSAQNQLSVLNGVNVDQANTNTGGLANNNPTGNGIAFGSGSGEGIASKRTAGSGQYGLDFYTSWANRMTISNPGNVGIGTTTPGQKLTVAGTIESTS